MQNWKKWMTTAVVAGSTSTMLAVITPLTFAEETAAAEDQAAAEEPVVAEEPVTPGDSEADPSEQTLPDTGGPKTVGSKTVGSKTVLDGAKVFAWNCGSCHSERYPKEHSDAEWDLIVTHMRVRANLTGEQARAVLRYLKENNE